MACLLLALLLGRRRRLAVPALFLFVSCMPVSRRRGASLASFGRSLLPSRRTTTSDAIAVLVFCSRRRVRVSPHAIDARVKDAAKRAGSRASRAATWASFFWEAPRPCPRSDARPRPRIRHHHRRRGRAAGSPARSASGGGPSTTTPTRATTAATARRFVQRRRARSRARRPRAAPGPPRARPRSRPRARPSPPRVLSLGSRPPRKPRGARPRPAISRLPCARRRRRGARRAPAP